MRSRGFALIGFTAIFVGCIYYVARIYELKTMKRQQFKIESQVHNRLPNGVLRPSFIVPPVVPKETKPGIPPTITPVISLDVVRSWTTQNIIGLAHNDPYLIAYIKTKLHPIPQLMPYNLSNATKKDFSQVNQTVEVKKFFKEKVNGIFVEVGAYDGETFSNTLYWEREYGWTGLLIEPDPGIFQRLLTKHRRAYTLQACLCPTNFANVTKFLNIGTGAKIANPNQKSVIEVPCYPFYSIMAALDFPPIDLFSLDIEGWELTVLKTIPFELLNIRMLMVEFAHIPEKLEGLTKFMDEHGYDVYKTLEFDSIYVKKGVYLSS